MSSPLSLLPIAIAHVTALVIACATLRTRRSSTRATALLCAAALAAALGTAQSLPRTTDSSLLRQCRTIVAQVWEPRLSLASSTARATGIPSRIVTGTASPSEVSAVAREAAQRGQPGTAAALFYDALILAR